MEKAQVSRVLTTTDMDVTQSTGKVQLKSLAFSVCPVCT
jgi:hypothetical protein